MGDSCRHYVHIFLIMLLLFSWPKHSYAMHKTRPWQPHEEYLLHEHRPLQFINPNWISSTNMPQPRPSPPIDPPQEMPRYQFADSSTTPDSQTRTNLVEAPPASNAPDAAGLLQAYAPATQMYSQTTPGRHFLRNVINLIDRDTHNIVNPGALGTHLSRNAFFFAIFNTPMTDAQRHYFQTLARTRPFSNTQTLAHALLKDSQTIREALNRYLHNYPTTRCTWACDYQLSIPYTALRLPINLLFIHDYIATMRLGQQIPTGSFCNLGTFLIQFLRTASQYIAHQTDTPPNP